MWSLSQVFEHARTVSHFHQGFLSVNDKCVFRDPKNTFFIMQVHYEISDELYRATHKFQPVLEVILSEQLLGVGKSTLQFLSTINRKEDGKELVRLSYKYCHVNREQRKSEPFPEWFLSAYSSYQTLDEKFQPEAVPQNKVFCWDYTTIPSDSDFNGHINQSVYIRLCFDCGTLALKAGSFHNFKKDDLCKYRVKSLYAFYSREALSGNKLSIFVWESESRIGELNFQINRGTDKLYFSRALFHEFFESKL